MGNTFSETEEQRRIREAEEARRLEEERQASELREKIRQAHLAKLQAERKLEHERQERLRDEQALRRRQEQEALERRRLELARLKAEEERRAARALYVANAREELATQIDEYIRTRKNFDDSDPLSYRCDISSIVAQFESKRNKDAIPESIVEFVHSHIRFVVEGTKVGVRYLTPFQGADTHRVFGYFSCSECNRTWSSAASWKNKWQKCQHCETKIYPYRQHVLEKRDEGEITTDSRRPHDMSRCQKCKELGRLCVPSMYYAAYL
jgi:hypothetical protein